MPRAGSVEVGDSNADATAAHDEARGEAAADKSPRWRTSRDDAGWSAQDSKREVQPALNQGERPARWGTSGAQDVVSCRQSFNSMRVE
jgi:hypothetical protein